MNKCFYLLLFPVLLLSKNIIFEWEDKVLFDSDFYQAVPFSQWSDLDSLRKVNLLDDFLYKELVFYHAKKTGLDHYPKISFKLHERKKQLLINNYYESVVALPMVNKNYLELTEKHLTEKVFVHHLLLGFNGCALKSSFDRSVEESLLLANQIKSTFVDSSLYFSLDEKLALFGEFATEYSEDPSVSSNLGVIGWISWGQVMPTFQKTAFSSSVFTISDPVLTDYGYHLVFVEKRGFSDYYYYNPDYLQGFSFKFGVQSTPVDLLRSAASLHDSLMFSDGGFIINNQYANTIVDFVLEKMKEENLRGGKAQYLAWFEEFVEKDVLFVFNGKGFGLGWVVDKLRSSPASRVPRITSYDDFFSLISSLVLHAGVLEGCEKKHLIDVEYYRQEFVEHTKNILYKEYEKLILSRLVVDSLSVIEKYNSDLTLGKHQKPREVVFSEIRVDRKSLVDSLSFELGVGVSFDVLLSRYGGGLKKPIKEGRGGFIGEAAFALSVGGISPPIENLNKTFSIIRVERFLNASVDSLVNVFESIESSLLKNKKDLVKNNLGVDLVKQYDVKKNVGFLFF